MTEPKAQVDGALADLGLVPWSWCMTSGMSGSLDGGLDQVLDERLARVFARAGAGLQDHRCARFVGGFHDGLDLFQVVDVECRNAIAVFGGVVQQLAHRDECHVNPQGSVGNGLVTARILLRLGPGRPRKARTSSRTGERNFNGAATAAMTVTWLTPSSRRTVVSTPCGLQPPRQPSRVAHRVHQAVLVGGDQQGSGRLGRHMFHRLRVARGVGPAERPPGGRVF
jgi:hypothetical protein